MTADGIDGILEMIDTTTRTGNEVYDTMGIGFGIGRRQEGVHLGFTGLGRRESSFVGL